jgi:hypothetical protein
MPTFAGFPLKTAPHNQAFSVLSASRAVSKLRLRFLFTYPQPDSRPVALHQYASIVHAIKSRSIRSAHTGLYCSGKPLTF